MTASLVGIDFNIILQLVNTLVLFLLLRHFLFRPVSEFMASRRDKIKQSFDQARGEEEQAQKLKGEYETKLKGIREEAQNIIREASIKAEERKQEIVKEAKKEAERILARAQKEIQLEKEKAMSEIKTQIVDLAIISAQKVIEKNLDNKTCRGIVSDFIDGVGKVS